MRRQKRWRIGLLFAALGGFWSPALAAAESAVVEHYEAGSETLWWVEVGGERIGHNLSRYEGEVDLGPLRAHQFREQVLLDSAVPGGRLVQKYTNELWTNDRGRPLKVVFRAEISEAKSEVSAVFDLEGGTAAVEIRQGPTQRSQEIELSGEPFVLANNFVSHLDLALALDPPPVGQGGALPFLSINVLREFPLNLTPLEQESSASGNQALDGRRFRDSLGEILHVDATGRLERVEVPAQNLIFRRVEDRDELAAVQRLHIELPPLQERADDLTYEEVTIRHGKVTLAGTVTRPKSVPAEKPLPGVFFISGSGTQDRDGMSSGIDLGTRELLDRLTREGFLVLRVDDRGAGESTGPTAGLTFEDLVEDARQAVRFLMEREDVDAERIALIGHSEGGQTAPLLAAEMELGAIVLMAAPGRPVTDLLAEQLDRGAALAGKSDEERAELATALQSFLAKLEADEEVSADDLPAELAMLAGGGAWLKSHARQDPVANLQRVDEPVLILQGARDFQVLERDAEALAAGLEEVEHADFELVIFPELDHLFKKTAGGPGAGLDYLKNRPLDTEFLDTVVQWLKRRLIPEE